VAGNMQEMMQLRRGKLQQQAGAFSGGGSFSVRLGKSGTEVTMQSQLEGNQPECRSLMQELSSYTSKRATALFPQQF